MHGGLRKNGIILRSRFCAYRRHQAANCYKRRLRQVAVFGAALRQAMRLTVYGRYTDFCLMSLGLNVRVGS
jgi:hypothetical protein